MYSDARGTVRITSTIPARTRPIRFNYLSTEQDRREWVEAIRVTRKILGQDAFGPFDGGELSPGPQVETDEQILDWVAKDAETALIPRAPPAWVPATSRCSTRIPCGSTARRSLRVVDASAMPYVTNGNIYAPVMMLAEKAADLIAGNTPLAPATDVDWYRAG